MKTNGMTLRNAGGLTGAEAVGAMQTILDDYTNMAALFPEGSIVGDSKALPAIWENMAAFNAIIDSGKTAATAGLAARPVGRCGGLCHRAPDHRRHLWPMPPAVPRPELTQVYIASKAIGRPSGRPFFFSA